MCYYLLQQLLCLCAFKIQILYAFSVIDRSSLVNTSIAITAACPVNWIPSDENDYKCYSVPTVSTMTGDYNWFDVGSTCAMKQATPIMPKTEQELADLKSQLWDTYNLFPGAIVFVGLEKFLGNWTWLDGEDFEMPERWCSGQGGDSNLDPVEKCAMLQQNYDGALCFDSIKCSDEPQNSYTICEKLTGPIQECESASWIPRPGEETCYFISKSKDLTYWDRAFCSCMDDGAILMPLESMSEATWLAGKVFERENLDIHNAESYSYPVMVGLTSLPPFNGWSWVQGLPLENYTAPFWSQGIIPPSKNNSSASDGPWCAALSWKKDGPKPTAYNPILQAWNCMTGTANFVCMKTNQTTSRDFPVETLLLHDKICSHKDLTLDRAGELINSDKK